MSEPTYTLPEAQLILARRECARWGHDLTEIRTLYGIVPRIVCARCDARWSPDEKTAQQQADPEVEL